LNIIERREKGIAYFRKQGGLNSGTKGECRAVGVRSKGRLLWDGSLKNKHLLANANLKVKPWNGIELKWHDAKSGAVSAGERKVDKKSQRVK